MDDDIGHKLDCEAWEPFVTATNGVPAESNTTVCKSFALFLPAGITTPAVDESDWLFIEDPAVFGQIWFGSFNKGNRSGSGHSQRVTDLDLVVPLWLVSHKSEPASFKCEREFHVGCLKEHNMADLKFSPSKCFCCMAYDTILYALVKLINYGEQKLPESSSDDFKKRESFKGEEDSYLDDEV
ncbi:hypothetical protein ACFE04_002913 [Oxalis oulophora]